MAIDKPISKSVLRVRNISASAPVTVELQRMNGDIESIYFPVSTTLYFKDVKHIKTSASTVDYIESETLIPVL